MSTIAEQYIDDVLNNHIAAGPWIVKAFQRHRRDLETGKDRGLYFDPAAGDFVIEFIQGFCIPSERTESLCLLPWQHALIYILYGWKRLKDNSRRFRWSYCEIAKKNGKTALGAALCNYHLVADGEISARCFCTANTGKQARKCFEEACAMRNNHPELKALIKQSGQDHPIALHTTNLSRLSCMSRDSAQEDGALVSFAILDEIHEYTNRKIWSILRYGGRTRSQPLLFGITTAGASAGGTSICWSERTYCTKVLDGFIEDDECAPFIFCMDDKDDWRDEKNWVKSNPSMGDTSKGYLFDLDTIRKEFEKTEGQPTLRGEFLRYCLNKWSSESAEPALEPGAWDACGRGDPDTYPDPKRLRKESIEELKGRPCFAGVDLAPKIDTSALVLVFPPLKVGEKWRILEWFWCPADNVADRVKRDRVPYDVWSRDGFITLTPGNTTDVRFISDTLIEISKLFDLKEGYFDPAYSDELFRMVGETDAKLHAKFVSFKQWFLQMNSPCNELMRKILRLEFSHDRNPVMRWQMANLRWSTQKGTGFVRPNRDKPREKIDGAVSLIMALACASSPDNIVKPKKPFFVVTSE
jgi:phage terminase large subunit-like protein